MIENVNIKTQVSSLEIKSYEEIRGILRVRLMDMKDNAELLGDIVYQPVGCGLALAAYMKLPEEIAGGGVANVPKGLIAGMGIDEAQVMEDALKGSEEKESPKLFSIMDVLAGMAMDEPSGNLLTAECEPQQGLLVLTTKSGLLGASALFLPGMKERIAEVVGGDYYVLPSSVHEVLILPDNGAMPPADLAQMVRSINESEVAPQDRLCNRVFKYHADFRELTMASDPDRRREMER